MADLTITASNVVPTNPAAGRVYTAGEAVTAGQVVYQHTDDKAYKADTSTAAKAAAKGITLNAAAAGQPVSVLESGPLAFGAILTAGQVYCVSDTAGGIRPVADNGSGDYVTVLGIATSTSVLNVDISQSGVAHG